MKKHLIFGTLILSAILILASCYLPSPLYGEWSDNNGNGNKLTFQTGGDFTAIIVNDDNTKKEYNGTYTVIDNVIVFNIVDDTTYTRNAVWDLSGAILKLYWEIDGTKKNLVLYHTAR